MGEGRDRSLRACRAWINRSVGDLDGGEEAGVSEQTGNGMGRLRFLRRRVPDSPAKRRLILWG